MRTIVLDWDYRTFDIFENGDIILYDLEDEPSPPDEVVLIGPDDFQSRKVAQRIKDHTYRIND